MNESKLTERLRAVLRASTAPAEAVRTSRGAPRRSDIPPDAVERLAPGDSLESVLGGEWRRRPDGGSCFVVERRRTADDIHGRTRIGEIVEGLDRQAAHASIFVGGAPVHPPLVFLDLETTGLNGGAGTSVFLVGLGWCGGDGSFVTRQYLLAGYGDERPMLETVGTDLQQVGTLVTFNGKAFDGPMLETRYLFQRLDWPGATLRHLDVLHPARRFWRVATARRGDRAESGLRRVVSDEEACSLTALERRVLGARRRGDIPGFAIPSRYFQFVRSRDAHPLVDVLEHNRLDLLSLAGVTARLLYLVAGGADAAGDAREALALGMIYARADDELRARAALEKALEIGDRAIVEAEASRALALLERRARRHDRAAVHWRRVLDCAGGPGHLVREATEALAIHHEHRLRDLESAEAFALQHATEAVHAASVTAARLRLARIQRKLAARGAPP
jgi:uncharacterized protein YprB with RNaseH-like and TPR domain